MRQKNHIAHYREKAGLSQTELAEKMGVGQTAVSNWEIGLRCPRPTMLIKLAKVLGVTAEDLLGE